GRGHARRGRGPRRTRSVHHDPSSAGAAVVSLPAPRPGVEALDGYHSPQLDVPVRLNTNESPFAPPPAFVDAWLEALAAIDLNRYPDREGNDLRGGIAHERMRV